MRNLHPVMQQALRPFAPKVDRMAVSSQTPPTGDGAIVLDAVLQRLANMASVSSIQFHPSQMLKDDLEARAEMGLKKYGTKLRINNGRRAIVDLYQEIMDAIMYAMQARLEGDVDAGKFVEPLIQYGTMIAAHINARG